MSASRGVCVGDGRGWGNITIAKIKIYENSSREEEQKERKIKDRTEKKENINKRKGRNQNDRKYNMV